jgi:hypothetical protein
MWSLYSCVCESLYVYHLPVLWLNLTHTNSKELIIVISEFVASQLIGNWKSAILGIPPGKRLNFINGQTVNQGFCLSGESLSITFTHYFRSNAVPKYSTGMFCDFYVSSGRKPTTEYR